jgi:sulfate transport system substrate-binding protein
VAQQSVTLLNVSYDPTRELYVEFNAAFAEYWKAKYAKQFASLKTFTINEAFGGWEKADAEHFTDGASFDRIYTKK